MKLSENYYKNVVNTRYKSYVQRVIAKKQGPLPPIFIRCMCRGHTYATLTKISPNPNDRLILCKELFKQKRKLAKITKRVVNTRYTSHVRRVIAKKQGPLTPIFIRFMCRGHPYASLTKISPNPNDRLICAKRCSTPLKYTGWNKK